MVPQSTRRIQDPSPIYVLVVGLLPAAVLVAVLVFSPFYPQSVEWDPSHGHVVVGGDGHEQARALATHLQGEARDLWSATDRGAESAQCDVDGPNEVCVLAIRAGVAGTVTAFGIGGGIVAVGHDAGIRPTAFTGRLKVFGTSRVATPAIPVPDPPPRTT